MIEEPVMSDENTMRPGDNDPGKDPLSELLRRMGLNVPSQGLDLNAMMSQFQQAMTQAASHSDSSTGIDWDATKRAVRHEVSALGPDPLPTQTQRRELADAERLAESWLDAITSFAAADAPVQAWTRGQWVDDTMDSWRTIVEPIVSAIAEAMSKTMGGQVSAESPELAQLTGMLGPILRTAAGQMYAAQLAEAIGKVAADVLTGAELGVQLLSQPRVVMLSSNAQAFVRGLELPDADVLMYLTVREAARQRLFARVSWLGPQLLALIEHYARGITIDMEALTEVIDPGSMAELTPDRLQELSKQLQGRLFTPSRSSEQNEVLERLETLLALIEGWVDTVSHDAASPWLSHEEALMEVVRRRRATGGPTEKMFGSLVGLELRPRRVRDAQRLWQAVQAAKGSEGRDAVWSHPDLMPTAADLDDPLGFSNGEHAEADEHNWDDELAQLLADQDKGDDNSGNDLGNDTPEHPGPSQG